MAEHPLDVNLAAHYVGLGTTAFLGLVREGQIPHGREGRRYTFTRAQLDEWLEAHARIHPGELAHMSQPIDGSGRYRRGGSTRTAHR